MHAQRANAGCDAPVALYGEAATLAAAAAAPHQPPPPPLHSASCALFALEGRRLMGSNVTERVLCLLQFAGGAGGRVGVVGLRMWKLRKKTRTVKGGYYDRTSPGVQIFS